MLASDQHVGESPPASVCDRQRVDLIFVCYPGLTAESGFGMFCTWPLHSYL